MAKVRAIWHAWRDCMRPIGRRDRSMLSVILPRGRALVPRRQRWIAKGDVKGIYEDSR